MYKKFLRCENWDDITKLIARLINENEQLKSEKQQLVNEVVNLKLQMKKIEKRKARAYRVLISEMECD